MCIIPKLQYIRLHIIINRIVYTRDYIIIRPLDHRKYVDRENSNLPEM